ncbi:MAG: 4Fe-4S dicluster domain-containing protein, partial [Actinomycetota bacterium]|nr:4Fe-4S dicluster domain-containing protein [Actinomycetota bacterium]
MSEETSTPAPLGTELPEGVRFVGREGVASPNWLGPDHPTDTDLDACVACGLCLPHCPTYRLTGDESASPRGRITAMRAVADGLTEVDDTFASFMDRCLVCRACEEVCPSHVPFGRMMEAARTQLEPRRSTGARLLRWLGL